jgi:pimeloyl-ACP methyl ester carboxylesterase
MKLRRQIRKIAMQLFLVIFTLVESTYAQVGLEQLIWKEFKISSQLTEQQISIGTYHSGISPQLEYFPIIFIHGHGASKEVENTWTDFIKKNFDGQNGYSYFGKIYSLDDIPYGLTKRNIFSFCFYRDHKEDAFHKPGHIGIIPISYSGSSPDYYNWNGANRISYAKRLSQVVDRIVEKTGSSKVIIIAHSMGGLVARAYIRWGGGADKVYKLLTVATPNRGIPDDVRNTLLQFIEFFKGANWQVGGEYEEMSQARNFDGHSYTYWLNYGWEEFCAQHGVRYATIRGNYCPYINLINIGDGVVDEGDAQIDGAEFNGVVYATHIDDFKTPVIVNTYPKELSIVSATYTREIIKRWIFEDRIHIGARFLKYENNPKFFMYAPNPFNERVLFDYELEGYAVSASLFIHSIAGELVGVFGIPLFPGINQPTINLDNLANGVYLYHIKAYDMNGVILEENDEIAKLCCSEEQDLPIRPIITVYGPEFITPNSFASFKITSNVSTSHFRYKLDENEWSTYSESNEIYIDNLSEGIHTLYVSCFAPGFGYPEKPEVYTWIVSKLTTEKTNPFLCPVDVNGDGKYDLVAFGPPGTSNAGVVYVGLSTGTGFEAWSWSYGMISDNSPVLFGDVNGDGKDDLVAIGPPGASNAGVVYVGLSTGTGFEAWSWSYGMISDNSPVFLADVGQIQVSFMLGLVQGQDLKHGVGIQGA